MNALILEKRGVATVKQVPIPTLSPGEILVKTYSVALNPSDWKKRDLFGPLGSCLGANAAGIVTKVSEGVTEVKVGDRVAGAPPGGFFPNPEFGAFAEFFKLDWDLVWKVPESLSWEEAAALAGFGSNSAWQAIHLELNLARPSAPLQTPEPLLIWSGASSVGLYAVQLAKMGGYRVIATCSPKNFELLKATGADEVYDYADPETPAKISAAHPTLAVAFDTYSENGSIGLAAKSLGAQATTPLRIATVLPPTESDKAVRDVTITPLTGILLYGKAMHAFGQYYPVNLEVRTAYAEWLRAFPNLLAAGYKSNPVWKQEGGLERIKEGLDLLKEGKVSGQKVVYLV